MICCLADTYDYWHGWPAWQSWSHSCRSSSASCLVSSLNAKCLMSSYLAMHWLVPWFATVPYFGLLFRLCLSSAKQHPVKLTCTMALWHLASIKHESVTHSFVSTLMRVSSFLLLGWRAVILFANDLVGYLEEQRKILRISLSSTNNSYCSKFTHRLVLWDFSFCRSFSAALHLPVFALSSWSVGHKRANNQLAKALYFRHVKGRVWHTFGCHTSVPLGSHFIPILVCGQNPTVSNYVCSLSPLASKWIVFVTMLHSVL
jgi:hypothetical protein